MGGGTQKQTTQAEANFIATIHRWLRIPSNGR